ncbi:MAG: hypothetical protein K8U03_14270 [Planctomycetia bacterium]|nr:hypothetical protein [Planctomycetia bacterium]
MAKIPLDWRARLSKPATADKPLLRAVAEMSACYCLPQFMVGLLFTDDPTFSLLMPVWSFFMIGLRFAHDGFAIIGVSAIVSFTILGIGFTGVMNRPLFRYCCALMVVASTLTALIGAQLFVYSRVR